MQVHTASAIVRAVPQTLTLLEIARPSSDHQHHKMRAVTLVCALLAAGAFAARQPALLQAGDVVVTNETPCQACGDLLAMLQVFPAESVTRLLHHQAAEN